LLRDNDAKDYEKNLLRLEKEIKELKMKLKRK
jgi:hypothetical protein